MPRPEITATVRVLAARFGGKVFTSTQAEELGVAQHRLHTAHRSGTLIRLDRGRYQLSAEALRAERVPGSGRGEGADISAIPGVSEAEAARVRDRVTLFAADGVNSGLGSTTAAAAWELPIYDVPASPLPVLLVPRGSSIRPGKQAGVHVTHRDVDPVRLVPGPGNVPMTDPLLTAVHIAAGPAHVPGRTNSRAPWRTATTVGVDAWAAGASGHPRHGRRDGRCLRPHGPRR